MNENNTLKPSTVSYKKNSWTEAQINELKTLFPTHDNKTVAETLKKPISGVRSMAFKLKLKKATHYWTPAQEKFLIEAWPTHSPLEIAALLESRYDTIKTRWAVFNKYMELKRRGLTLQC